MSDRRPRPRAAYDFDLALSGHETLENFDLCEHKAFIHARRHKDKLITGLFNVAMAW